VAILGTSASAGELHAKERWDAIERGMKGEREELTKQCGKGIPDSIDKNSFKDEIYNGVGPQACSVMIKAIHSICNPAYPERAKAIHKRIKKIECKYGGPLSGKVKKAMKDSNDMYSVPGSEQQLKITKSGVFEWTMHYDKDTEWLVFTRGDNLLQDIGNFLDKQL
jgi:hypothetical protein